MASTIFLLGATLPYVQRFADEDKDEPLPMMNLSEACLMAVESMCGGTDGDPPSKGPRRDKYSHLRRDASVMACAAALRAVRSARDVASLAGAEGHAVHSAGRA